MERRKLFQLIITLPGTAFAREIYFFSPLPRRRVKTLFPRALFSFLQAT